MYLVLVNKNIVLTLVNIWKAYPESEKSQNNLLFNLYQSFKFLSNFFAKQLVVNIDIDWTTYVPLVDIGWHFNKYLPTSSCQRSYWISP